MSEYIAPLKEMNFVLNEIAGLAEICANSKHEGVSIDLMPSILEEAGKLASGMFSPANIVGDHNPARVEDNKVIESPGFADAYQAFVEGGWASISGDPEYGGMGLPEVIDGACAEMWMSANVSLSLCPTLTHGAVSAIEAAASDELKAIYLPKMISGEWTGTMNLTEPQAGSDLAAVKTKAERDGDQYRISGTKIFITWGDHQMTDNIIHLVLARLPDAPDGVRGISLFVVPKFLVNEDGSLGERNDVYPLSVEHKLGIHGSPTCVMGFGQADNSEGAIGYLVGQENRGLMHMFVMMNAARLHVGMQGVGVSERAYQHARDYALERVQGNDSEGNSATIIAHADVRRMLLEMRSLTEAARAITYVAMSQLDRVEQGDERAMARVEYLTPIAKGFSTEVAQEITGLGVQVHGGMGFVEETGAAQFYRDAKIMPIYEGTTGIQAMDLIGRKLMSDSGGRFKLMISEIKEELSATVTGDRTREIVASVVQRVDEMENATTWILDNAGTDADLPGSVAFHLLMLNGYVLGGFYLAKGAVVAEQKISEDSEFYDAKIKVAEFFVSSIMPRALAHIGSIKAGSGTLMQLREDQF